VDFEQRLVVEETLALIHEAYLLVLMVGHCLRPLVGGRAKLQLHARGRFREDVAVHCDFRQRARRFRENTERVKERGFAAAVPLDRDSAFARTNQQTDAGFACSGLPNTAKPAHILVELPMLMPRIAALTLLAATSAFAAERTLELDLAKAVRMALKKNFTIQTERFEPKIAKQRERSAEGNFDAVFDFSYTRGEDTTRDRFTRDSLGTGRHLAFDDIAQTSAWSTGVSGVTVWGLGYDVGATTRNFSGTANRFDEDVSSGMSFSLRQPLLRGAGPDANLAGVRVARNNVASSEWGLRQRIMQVITDVIEVYNDLNFAHENLDVAIRSRELARTLLKDNIKRVEIGVMRPLDVTTAQAEVAAREEAVITAQRSVKDQENFLKQLITADLLPLLRTSISIAPPTSQPLRGNVIEGITRALELRPDYRQAKLDIENRHISLRFEKNQLLPRLDLTASLALNGFDDDFITSARRIHARDQSSWSTGAIFSVPIGNREAAGRVEASKLEIAQALTNLQRLEQDIIVRVDNARGAVVTASQRIEATVEARRLAKESLDAGEKRLIAGTGTVFEVLELQDKLASSETSAFRARADYNKATARFHLETGTTLRAHGVKIE
jgi:outer membrane protein